MCWLQRLYSSLCYNNSPANRQIPSPIDQFWHCYQPNYPSTFRWYTPGSGPLPGEYPPTNYYDVFGSDDKFQCNRYPPFISPIPPNPSTREPNFPHNFYHTEHTEINPILARQRGGPNIVWDLAVSPFHHCQWVHSDVPHLFSYDQQLTCPPCIAVEIHLPRRSWGPIYYADSPIRVHPRPHTTSTTVHDVMEAVYKYFQYRLTNEEVTGASQAEIDRVNLAYERRRLRIPHPQEDVRKHVDALGHTFMFGGLSYRHQERGVLSLNLHLQV